MTAEVMNSDQYSLLLFCEQMFLMTGRLPDESTCAAAGHSGAVYKKCIKLPVFNLGLSQRGIRPYNELRGDGSVSRQLSPEQLQAANIILDQNDNRSRKKKLSDLKIPTERWETWLRDPAFQEYLHVRGEAVLGDHSHDAMLSLVKRVQVGDIAAIKYYHEITGRFIPSRERGVDPQQVLLRVMEIIQRRVGDPQVQMLIADDLIELAKESSSQFQGTPLVSQLRPVGTRPREIESHVVYSEPPITQAESSAMEM